MRKPLAPLGNDLGHDQDHCHHLQRGRDIPLHHPCQNQKNADLIHVTGQSRQKEVERSIHILYPLLAQVVEDLDHALCPTTRQHHIHEEEDHILSHQEDHVTIQDLGQILSLREGQTGIPHQNLSHIKRRNIDHDHTRGQDPQGSTDETCHFFNRTEIQYILRMAMDYWITLFLLHLYRYTYIALTKFCL